MTENKRFEVVLNEFDEVEYIMDKEMMEDRDFAEFIDFVEDVCNENEQLKQSYKEFEDECQSTFNAMNRKQNDLYRKNFKLKEENEQLRFDFKEMKGLLHSLEDEIAKLEKENKELQERNNRQAKQLDNLYTLIEKQDWKTLTGIIQEFQECEEQLQKEWGSYGDEWIIKEKDEHLSWKRVDVE